MKTFKVYSDGGARGNPGPAALGAVVYDAVGEKLCEISRYLGVATNNQAEYEALFSGLEYVRSLGGEYVVCYLDSELVVRQMSGVYKVKNQALSEIYNRVSEVAKYFKKIEYNHIPREKNKEADSLVNNVLDKVAK